MTSPEQLSLTDVVEAEERVAHGGELVATHVRYVLGFNRPATDAEVEVLDETLRKVEVVRSVSASGVEVVTPDRETPERPVAAIRAVVDTASEEARRRVEDAARRQAAEADRAADLQASLLRELTPEA